MKSFKMKALSLAVLGLTGLGMAGAASAVTCGPANLSAWSGPITNHGTLAVVPTGLEATPSACKLQATLTSPDHGSTAAVFYSDSTSEPTYHFRFYFNQDSLTGITGGSSAQIFAADSPNAPNGVSFALELGLIPGPGGKNQLVAALACSDASQQFICLTSPILLNAGNHYVEGSLSQGTSSTFNMWVDHNAAATVQPAPDATVTVNNNAWGGVNLVALGLAAPSPGFKINQPISLDAFDSRRQTFIGP